MKAIVLDTETIGQVSQDLLNVGYQIIDIDIENHECTVLQSRDYLVSKLYKNKVYCINDTFVGPLKYAMYEQLVANKGIVRRSIPQIFEMVAKDIERYGVEYGYAYNSSFDVDKFERTARAYGIDNPLDKIRVHDIMAYAYHAIHDTNEYKAWARENEVFTATGFYVKTSVESTCQYLYDNLEFAEDHTALSDVRHEVNILMECIKNGADITRESTKGHKIPANKVYTDKIVTPNGEQEIEYTYKRQRGEVITYKNE